LNNDTEVISQEWLSAMLECAQRDDVGAVGAKLLYPNDTIQHAGVMIGIGGIANHPHRGYPRVSHGYMGALSVIHNVSAVTGACMMVRKEVFNEVGGLNESLSHAYNDVDLCLKMREKGYLIIYTPYAELYHHESASRGYEDTPGRKARFLEEKDILYARWKHVFNAGDPYYSPNLTVEREDVSIKISTG
jgi:GT2 family glycosyltransferase